MTQPVMLDAIFTILMIGALEFYNNDNTYNIPDKVIYDTAEFKEGNFKYADFINKRCERGTDTSVGQYRVNATELHNAYKEYQEDKHDGDHDSQKVFGDKMHDYMGTRNCIRSNGLSTYLGIRLKERPVVGILIVWGISHCVMLMIF